MSLLEGKCAIITGAGRGLGECHAQRLAEEGAAIVVNDIGLDADGTPLSERVVEGIVANGGRAVANRSDVSTTQGAQELFETAINTFGSADILINNAGILRDRTLLKTEEKDWDDVIRVNLRSMYCVTKPVFAWMKDNGGGVIVNTSSTSGLIGNFGQANYAASKGGAWTFSNVLALEGRKAAIRVWTLAPAAMSSLTAHLVDEKTAAELQPGFVSEAVLYMVSSLSGDRTGRCLFASGQRIMELKLHAAPGIAGGGRLQGLDAHGIAAAADRIFLDSPDLTLADLSTD